AGSEVVSTPSVHDEVPVAGWGSPPSTLTETPARPPASAAVPATETFPPTVAPPDGAEMVTTGGVVSAFEELKLTLAVAAFPAASLVRAVTVWAPSARLRVSRAKLQLVVPCAV